MAEFVQSNLEDMLPELEQMARVKLFTSAETRAILKKRKAFEYKLRRKTKQKEDFLHYIEYETNVLALVKKRRKKTGYGFKRIEIDVAIISRIHRLFRTVCYRFQEDVKLWLSHIQFSKNRGEKKPVSKLFTRLLQVHSRKPELWIAAAKWEIETNASMHMARSLLQRALRFIPSSQRLWVEYFRMEMLNADKVRKRRELLGLANLDVDDADVADVVVEGRLAKVVFKQAVIEIPGDVDFVLDFLPVLRLFSFGGSLEQAVFDHLTKSFSTDEKTWDAKARRVLHCETSQADDEVDEDMFAIYEKAVAQVSTDAMWTFYIQACEERLEHSTPERLHRLLDVFKRAEEKELLTEDMYLRWVLALRMTGQLELVASVLKRATCRHNKSVPLWYERLQNEMQAGKEQLAPLVDEALNSVSEKESLALWELALEHYMLNDKAKAEALLQSGVVQCRQVAVPMKAAYLDWTAVTRSIGATRKVYQSLSASQPVSVDFFRKYIGIQNAQATTKIKRLREVYETALREFGTNDPSLWLDYVRMELSHSLGSPEKVGQLYWRAVKALEGGQSESFITAYNLLQTGHIITTTTT